MSEGKHTAGPWQFRKDDWLIVAGQWHIAQMRPQGLETDANARLIASAPDMLAALQAITDLCKRSPANPFLADDMDRIAIAAIARATGHPSKTE